jgi:putative membrane protein
MPGKSLLFVSLILILAAGASFTHGADFNETKKLIDSNISCDKLNESQLEEIGDYYMEQMHPGSEHEMMDKMMGGEGSARLEQMHISMARRLYCNETGFWAGGMFPMSGGGMMGYGMMDGSLMGGSWGFLGILGLVFWILVIIVLILVAFWLYRKITSRESGSAIDILKRRYAGGQITKKEFEKMKKEIA